VFAVLKECFHHDKDKHESVFRAVCVIVQYAMDLGEPVFDV